MAREMEHLHGRATLSPANGSFLPKIPVFHFGTKSDKVKSVRKGKMRLPDTTGS